MVMLIFTETLFPVVHTGCFPHLQRAGTIVNPDLATVVSGEKNWSCPGSAPSIPCTHTGAHKVRYTDDEIHFRGTDGFREHEPRCWTAWSVREPPGLRSSQ